MKKIVDVEVKDSKIVFKIEDKFLFNKKEYNESIDINKINKIEKILESASHKEFTCIIFYQKVTEVESVLYEVPAFKYIGEIPKLFDKIIEYLDMNKIEVIETVI